MTRKAITRTLTDEERAARAKVLRNTRDHETEEPEAPTLSVFLEALAPIVGKFVAIARDADFDGASDAAVPIWPIQSLDTIYRQARGE